VESKITGTLIDKPGLVITSCRISSDMILWFSNLQEGAL
jgi:hypothetical protein